MGKTSITEEDYLKSIHELTEYEGYATLSDISRLLGTLRQSAYDEINILLQKNLVKRIERGKYVLTEIGQKQANLFLRKHRIAEILLYKGLSLEWKKLDELAMGIEHGMTEEIMERVCEKYGCERCPHGNPVPREDGTVMEIDDFSMSQASPGKTYMVSRIVYEESFILNFLSDNGIFPGTPIRCINSNKWSLDGGEVEFPPRVNQAVRLVNV